MNPENSPTDDKNLATPPQPNKKRWKGVVKEIIIFFIIAFGIIFPFRMYVAEPYLVDGRSMDPTFDTGDYLIVDKISNSARNPERNEVVIFKYPGDTRKSFIKRLIGLPGETVVIEDGKTTIINDENPNGLEVEESYVTHVANTSMRVTLNSDEYFVMGDNRAESFDSRSWGPLQKKYLLGRPVLRLFPLNKIGVLPGEIKE